MTQEELSILAQKYLSGQATEVEKRMLNEWYYDNPSEGEWVAQIPAEEGEDVIQLEQKMKNRLFNYLELGSGRAQGILRTLELEKNLPARSRRKFPAYWAAAALLILCLVSGLVYHQRHATTGVDIAPGSNKAELTLADGSKILLDSSRSGILVQQGNTSVQQTAKGTLAYHSLPARADAEVLYNLLSVPRGGQYRLELPDGSSVWLNATSSIRYPVAFGGKERLVEMKGEAYFEITPDPSRPFKVKVADREEIEVLGTQFNVNAYEDETILYTTLLQGRIRVAASGNPSGVSPKPGQQTLLDKSGQIQVNEGADEEAVMAWKKGMFVFNNEDIGSIMRQMERWYDVKVHYEGKVEDKTFTGQISRYAQVSQVLKMLELTQDIHFKVEANEITVRP
ncbi:FecR family protein [Flavitalea flava]